MSAVSQTVFNGARLCDVVFSEVYTLTANSLLTTHRNTAHLLSLSTLPFITSDHIVTYDSMDFLLVAEFFTCTVSTSFVWRAVCLFTDVSWVQHDVYHNRTVVVVLLHV